MGAPTPTWPTLARSGSEPVVTGFDAAGVDVTGLDIAGLDAGACLTLMITITRRRAALDATMIHAQARFADLRAETDTDGPGRAGEFTACEIAAALDLSPSTATTQLDLAVTATRRLPATLTALAAGTLDLRRVRAVVEATGVLSDAHTAAVEERILTRGGRGSHALFRQALRRAVLAVDPAGAAHRHAQRRRERAVRIQPVEDGMAELWALLPAADAQAAYQRIDALARHAATPGDARSADERRADVLTDLLLGRLHDDPPVRVEVGVVIPLPTLLGLTDAPGELVGYGPIPAGLARELAAQASWRRLLTDPVDGSVVEVGRRRFPSPGLARHVRARDRTCRFPGCGKAARACDLDHVRAYGEGGATAAGNLVAVCRGHHHRLKHRGGWTVTRTATGVVEWTSPQQRVYRTEPEPYPAPDADPAPAPKPESGPPPF
ncbi:HNH endonuclease signature motif containing protein [Frankia sp. CiP3]|uniref:HNH endonuclease signature motif containing protein n=1 Tax=Frankia sp. CiP3 TaxID=2880971 RepID=UPI001EF72E9A|nr:HNH endonuclease signature motif containing protein [Frankia sp. CiP3]